MEWYYGVNGSTNIRKRMIVKETPKQVVLENFRRELKSNYCRKWFKTRKEAKGYIVRMLSEKVTNLNNQLSKARDDLDCALAIKESSL